MKHMNQWSSLKNKSSLLKLLTWILEHLKAFWSALLSAGLQQMMSEGTRGLSAADLLWTSTWLVSGLCPPVLDSRWWTFWRNVPPGARSRVGSCKIHTSQQNDFRGRCSAQSERASDVQKKKTLGGRGKNAEPDHSWNKSEAIFVILMKSKWRWADRRRKWFRWTERTTPRLFFPGQWTHI